MKYISFKNTIFLLALLVFIFLPHIILAEMPPAPPNDNNTDNDNNNIWQNEKLGIYLEYPDSWTLLNSSTEGAMGLKFLGGKMLTSNNLPTYTYADNTPWSFVIIEVLERSGQFEIAGTNIIQLDGSTYEYFNNPYEIKNGQKHWIPTVKIFNAHNFNWSDIQVVSENQLNSYPRAKLLRATGDKKVYYLTESGMVRHIPSAEVFNSYGNNWEDIFEVSHDELNSYEPNQLIRAEGDYKVYLLENGAKKWIQTAEEFNNRNYNWSKIAPVNQAEINYYLEGTTTDSSLNQTDKQSSPVKDNSQEIQCVNECSVKGIKRCSGSAYQICENYDEDLCLEWSSTINCPSNAICQDGNCIQQKCSDGTSYNQCSTNKPLYCDNGSLINKCSICGCPSGEESQSDESCAIVEVITCTDSDGGINEWVDGKTTYESGLHRDSCEGTDTDYIKWTTLQEWYCTSDGVAKYEFIECSNGCIDGVCKKSTGNDSSTGVICVDSDNGKDYYTYGNVEHSDGSATAADYCESGTVLKENYCDNGYYAYEFYTCPNGCHLGVCL